jgi:hypothetical protein
MLITPDRSRVIYPAEDQQERRQSDNVGSPERRQRRLTLP